MKKHGKGLLSLLLMLMLVFSLMPTSFAEGRSYVVTLYSGESGVFADGSTKKQITVPAGERVELYQDLADLVNGVRLKDDRYYRKGIKLSGYDNSSESLQSTSFAVTKDVDYVVAYGISGDLVSYTVNYVDAAGNTLLPSDTYHGNVGDTPRVAYRYISGYRPNTYNYRFSGGLSADESLNVVDFIYTRTVAQTVYVDGPTIYTGTTVTVTGDGTAADQAGTGTATAAETTTNGSESTESGSAGAGEPGESGEAGGADIDIEPVELIEVNPEGVPLAGGEENTGTVQTALTTNRSKTILSVTVAGVSLLLLVLLFLLLKKRRKES